MAREADVARVAAERAGHTRGSSSLANEDASVGITEANVVADGAALAARARALRAEFAARRSWPSAGRGAGARSTSRSSAAARPSASSPLHADRLRRDAAGAVSSHRELRRPWDELHVDYAAHWSRCRARRAAGPVHRRRAHRGAARTPSACATTARRDLRVDAALATPWVIDVNPNCDISPDAGVAAARRRPPASTSRRSSSTIARLAVGGGGAPRERPRRGRRRSRRPRPA
ncbi:MAG: hypothetical protein HS111_36030 [Kofleriaceae bacterium]|nr:hypothetical protein [Kofleriaceae bacterium]